MDRSIIPPALCALGGAGALGAALVAEHVFGLQPCILCLYERIPYGLVAVIGLFGLVPGAGRGWRWTVSLICGAIMLGSSGLAGFHVGVEQHWWASIEACETGATPATLEELRARLESTTRPSCTEIPWSLFGISMAGYNFLFSVVAGIGLTAVSAAALIRDGRRPPHRRTA